jgi:hypothetical protein
MEEKEITPPEIAPCGIYCGGCPSFEKTCLGCSSQIQDGNQKRKSKWGCRIRRCCYEDKDLDFCSACEEFPCQKVHQKLLDSHPNDPRFNYRREIVENLILLDELGIKVFLREMDEKFTCPNCGVQVVWYHYHCTECGKRLSQ